ncbi:MAG: hypothetical protein AB7G21_13665 [Dehalococcoidia bacterium]
MSTRRIRGARALAVACLVLGAAALSACDRLEEIRGTSTPTATASGGAPVASGTPMPTITAAAAPTGTFPPTPGVPLEVNPIVNAVLTGDIDTLVRLTSMTPVACGPQQGPGSPPPCPPGVVPGTPVEVFPIATCEGEYRDASTLRPTYERLTGAENKSLVGVYEAPDPYLPHVEGDYVAVFSHDRPGQPGLGAGVLVKDARIGGIWFGCNALPSQIVPRNTDALWLRGS